MQTATATTAKQYFVTAEIKPDGTIGIVRIDSYPNLEHAHDDSRGHVNFLRSANQWPRPYGKLETKPLLRALAAWPMQVLTVIAASKHGFLGDEDNEMKRGLRSLADDDEHLVEAVNRCAVNEAGDEDRILLARKNKSGDTMLGPCELVGCDKHPGKFELHRWTWDVPSDGDHQSAIECGDADIVRSCPLCVEEDEDAP